MKRPDLHTFVQNLTQKLSAAAGLSDGQLIERWLANRDEAAFELLLRRHGPLVLGVCRRLLRDPRDVEDAFQAVFLTLLKKAGQLRDRSALAAWLYRIAYRVCLRALGSNQRTAAGPLPVEECVAPPEIDELLWRDLRPVLDAEVNALPERYRVPFVLCHLQGRTNQEAADVLGCPLGTILSRLHWARERLRTRLTRRGVAVSTALFAALTSSAGAAEVPAGLLKITLDVLSPVAVSARAAALSEGVLRAMYLTKLKATTALLALAVAVTVGTWGVLHRADAAAPQPPGKTPPPKAQPQDSDEGPKSRDYILVPARREGVIAFVGRVIGKSDKVDSKSVRKAEVGGVIVEYERLREGQRVTRGQVLGRIDDTLARQEMRIKEAKLQAAEAELRASKATENEAKVRYERGLKLLEKGAIGKEEVEGFRLTLERYVEETRGKTASVTVARHEVEQAATLVQMHEIRSPADGVLQAILKRDGEAVRQFDPVFRIKVEEK